MIRHRTPRPAFKCGGPHACLELMLLFIADALNSGCSLMAAEVMWTPEEEYDSLTPQEVNLEFPTLIPF